MRQIVWSETALDDFCELIAYIMADNPQAAESVAERVERCIELLGEMPTGRRGRVSGTYEKVVSGLPYVIAYALTERPVGEEVTVLRIIHGARDWSEGEWPE